MPRSIHFIIQCPWSSAFCYNSIYDTRGIKEMHLHGGFMRKALMFITLLVLMIGPLTAQAMSLEVAIRRAGGQGWGAQTAYGKLFDPKSLVTVRGKVLSIQRFTPLRQMGYGFLVIIQTKEETLDVHIGPGWFVAEQDFEIQPGDEITVRGSRIKFDERPTIIATRVQKGSKVLNLRTDDGIPVWSEEEGG